MDTKNYFIFDLDGTLTDPKAGICGCVAHAMRAVGMDPPPIDELTSFIGPPLVPQFQAFCGVSRETAEFMLVKYRERFSTVGLYENEIYPGIRDMLASLWEQGHIITLATSKPIDFSLKILEHFNILEYFDVTAGATMDEKRNTKEEVLAYALSLLAEKYGAKPFQCYMIGDRCYDVDAGRALGTHTIGVCYGYGSREEFERSGATYIVETVEELRDLLESL